MIQEPHSPDAAQRFTWPWLRERLFPRGTNLINWTSYIIIISAMVFYVLNPEIDHKDQRFFTTIMLLTLLLVVNMVWDDLRSLFPQKIMGSSVLLAISAGLILWSTSSGELVYMIYLVFMLVAQMHAMLPLLPAMTGTLLFAAAWTGVISQAGLDREAILSIWSGMVIGLIFTITISQVMRRYVEQTERANLLLSQLQAVNAELLAARQREKELAVAEERVRVARDLHDGLGHHLTALSIQLQAVEKLSKSSPEQAAEAAHNARNEVQAALKEVRQSVGMLRQAPVDLNNLPGAIDVLVAEYGQRCGLQASFEQAGSPLPLSPAVSMTLYRVAQEGLTNIQKHARQASQVWVRLSYRAGEVALRVQDDGQGPAGGFMVESASPDNCPSEDVKANGGFGLAGLRERAALLGGRLACGPRPTGGFELEISLPVQVS